MGQQRHTGAPPRDRHDIKALLGKRGLTLADVGLLCDPPVSRQAVSAVLIGDTTSIRIETALALACGFDLSYIQEVTRSRSFRSGNGGNNGGNRQPALKAVPGRSATQRREHADV